MQKISYWNTNHILFAALVLTGLLVFLGFGCTCLSASGARAAEQESAVYQTGNASAHFSNRSLSSGKKGEMVINLVSWNVQTFFDARTDGTEYGEFKGAKSSWSTEKYKDRLKRLADYMKKTDADIYCFMEIENEAVVMDIANQLQGSTSRGTKWYYATFGKDSGSAIGCAVFSKLPLEGISLHQIDYRTALPAHAFDGYVPGTRLVPPEMRPLLEVRLNTSLQTSLEDKATTVPLVLFVCHWKSKSGGEAESAVWRSCQEALLADRMQHALQDGAAVLACGDFNRGLSEFMWSYQTGSVELRSFRKYVTVTSPWFSSTQPGTYWYHGEWNKLDHIFAAGGTSIQTFYADTEGELITETGIPNGYSVLTGKGMSDHLPLVCTFTVSAQTTARR